MPTDPMTGDMEADVIVNSHILSFDQAMALRVAVSRFRSELRDDAHVRQAYGEKLARLYEQNLTAVERWILERCT